MTDTAKFKTDDGLAELHRLEETRRDGRGRIEYDGRLQTSYGITSGR